MKLFSRDKRVQSICEALIAKGFTAWMGGVHPRLRSPDGRVTITVPRTPSDYRAALNWKSQVRRQLRQAGLRIDV